jgi:S-ribosylhomocysteine lyase LuxS involved in autoinducer biosynthesis
MTVRDEFDAATHAAIVECSKLGYRPTYFMDMISKAHPVEVAKKLVLSGAEQAGFQKLVKMGKADLTVESLMLQPKYCCLFSKQELEAAKWRLENA